VLPRLPDVDSMNTNNDLPTFERSLAAQNLLEIICQNPGKTSGELRQILNCHSRYIERLIFILKTADKVRCKMSIKDARQRMWYAK
jgi:predicted HTH transcriptional regulator